MNTEHSQTTSLYHFSRRLKDDMGYLRATPPSLYTWTHPLINHNFTRLTHNSLFTCSHLSHTWCSFSQHRLLTWVFPKCSWPMSLKSSADILPSLSVSHISNIVLKWSAPFLPPSIGLRQPYTSAPSALAPSNTATTKEDLQVQALIESYCTRNTRSAK